MRKIAICLLLSLVPAKANATLFRSYGVGESSCSELSSIPPDDITSWLGGFLTGINYASANSSLARADVAHSISTPALVSLLDLYCAESPQEAIVDAAIDMIDRINSK